MPIHVGFAPRRNFLRSATATQLHDTCSRAAISRSLVHAQARELRTRVNAALESGAGHVVVDCLPWQDANIPLLCTLVRCVSRGRELGVRVELVNVSEALRDGVREAQLESRLGLS